MISFNEYFSKYKLKNKATSNKKIQQGFFSTGLDNVNIFVRDGPFSSDIGNVILHPSKGTHWVLNKNKIYSDSHGCAPPQKLSRFIIKRN